MRNVIELAPLAVLQKYPDHDYTLAGVLRSRAAVNGDKPLLLFEDSAFSWAGFEAEVERVARMLLALGAAEGDRIAIMALSSDRYAMLLFATARIGAILVPINPELRASEAAYILTHAEPKLVFCNTLTFEIARKALVEAALPSRMVALDSGCDSLQGWDQLLAETGKAAEPLPWASADQVSLIIYTSGTTGRPKGVMHTQCNFVTCGEAFVERMWLQPDDRLMCILPMYHLNALFYIIGGTLAAGASIVVLSRFSATTFWDVAARSGATQVNIVAAVGRILARRPRSEFNAAHRISKVYGAPITADIDAVFKDEFGVQAVTEGYGMSEIPGVANIPIHGPYKVGSFGVAARHPDHSRPFSELRIVDDDGRDVANGVVGQLLVRTPIIMKGYYRDPETTAASFRDGWFMTGDRVMRDHDGYYAFLGRQKDIIRRRGENISGAEIDQVICLHPGVVDAAAIAVDADLGEDEILVAIIKRPDAELGAVEIRDWCAQRLAPIKVPRYVVFVQSLPYTPTHRVAKYRLKEDTSLRFRAVDVHARFL